LFKLIGEPQQLFGFIVKRLPEEVSDALRMVANKQLLVKGAFKVFNGNRDRRLGNMQLPGGFSDTLGLYHGDEIFKLFERKSVIASPLIKYCPSANGIVFRYAICKHRAIPGIRLFPRWANDLFSVPRSQHYTAPPHPLNCTNLNQAAPN
jgi:hypothetical protein